MHQPKPPSTSRLRRHWQKWLNPALKLLIGGLLGWALYRQVFAEENARELWQTFAAHYNGSNLGWLALALALVPLNLALEALKFRQLIRNFTDSPFRTILRAVLAGVTIAIFTPNRVGEYGGRILFLPPEHNWKAVIATMVGSLSQLLVLLTAGLFGIAWFSARFLEMEPYSLPLMLCLGTAFIALLAFLFFNIDVVVPLAKRIPYIHKLGRYLRHLKVLQNYTTAELSGALGYAFMRYLTYCTQYYLLLRFYDIPVDWWTGMAGIASIFFVQASIPLPPVTGLLARGEIALFTWGFFSEDKLGILSATFTLFVINVAVPALVGLVFVVRTNILKSLGYENKN
ncbi:MAG: lysylphosphatidylglycerol synthase domain-containing protein [Saprospiraceae bacterium]